MRIGSLCTGYGGLDHAVQSVLGGALAFVADPDPGATAILAHHHPQVPNLGDIATVDWVAVPQADILTAGFPCQDISNAGRRAGIEGTRSGIWAHVVEAVGVLRPRFAVFENVSAITVRGLDTVLADLAEVGFDAEWSGVRASDVGAPHRRERWFCIAWPSDTAHLGHERARVARVGRSGPEDSGHPATNSSGYGWVEGWPESAGLVGGPDVAVGGGPDWGDYEPAVRRWEHVTGRRAPVPTEPGRTGQPRLSPRFVEWLMGLQEGHVTAPEIGLTRNQQLRALGNGVVPQQGAAALRLLLGRATAGVAA